MDKRSQKAALHRRFFVDVLHGCNVWQTYDSIIARVNEASYLAVDRQGIPQIAYLRKRPERRGSAGEQAGRQNAAWRFRQIGKPPISAIMMT
jgi:hypothetical protein